MNETIQLINSAIIKSRDLDLKTDLQERMTKIAESDEMDAFDAAITEFAKKQKVTKEQAAIRFVSTLRELDQIWSQYLLIEGSDKLKESFNNL